MLSPVMPKVVSNNVNLSRIVQFPLVRFGFGYIPNDTGRPSEGKLAIVANRESHAQPKRKQNRNDEWELPRSMGGVVTALMPVLQQGDFWIASRDAERSDVPFENLKDYVRDNHPELINHLPIYTPVDVEVSKDAINGHYNSISNEQIWPLSHTALDKMAPFSKSDWEKYVLVNKKFAKTITSKTDSADWVWIHDYHLMLVPEIVRGYGEKRNIAYFHHIPFQDMLAHFDARGNLVRGLLGADLVGFQTPSSVKSFVQAVQMHVPADQIRVVFDDAGDGATIILKSAEESNVKTRDRRIRVEAFPISIDAEDLETRMNTSTEISKFRRKWQQYKIDNQIEYLGAGVERLDYSKGILERVKAIDLFLDNHPEFIGKFTFVQVSAPTRTEIPAYKRFATVANRAIDSLNIKYRDSYRHMCEKRLKDEGIPLPANLDTWTPIKKEEKGLLNDDVMALFQTSDFAISNSIADGMNLVAKEFALAQGNQNSQGGILIASDTMGAAEEWTPYRSEWRKRANSLDIDAPQDFWVKPFNINATADAIYKALQLSPEQKKLIMEPIRDQIIQNDIHKWTRDFLHSFQAAVAHRYDVEEDAALKFAGKPFAISRFQKRNAGLITSTKLSTVA